MIAVAIIAARVIVVMGTPVRQSHSIGNGSGSSLSKDTVTAVVTVMAVVVCMS